MVVAALAGTDPGRARALAGTAEQVACSITDPQEQVHVLAEVAAALASTDADRAERVARIIPDPREQTWALAAIAARVGPPAADRLLGEAFALGSWVTPLCVLAWIRPHDMIRFADLVLADGLLERLTSWTASTPAHERGGLFD
ncbi:hypothetical protein GCM10009665_60130 [Kitasatospora nipponensis]|uniref:DUF4192 family protein n=1 Tax=Kitasatospora nipponensis TaxID=258049 RepID=A0ABN1WSL9_9ACTN